MKRDRKNRWLYAFLILVMLSIPATTLAANWWSSTNYVLLSSQTSDVTIDSMTVRIGSTNKTVANVYNAAQKKSNTSSYNSSAKYACAAYPHKFYEDVFGVTIYNLVSTSAVPKVLSGGGSFVQVSTPMVGDIIRINTSVHWAIVKSVDASGTVTVIQQNAGYFDDSGKYRAMVETKVKSPYSNVSFFRYSTTGWSKFTNASNEAETLTVVQGNGDLYIRAYPYGASLAIKSVKTGQSVEVVGSVINSAGNTWYKVKGGGYIYSGITNKNGFKLNFLSGSSSTIKGTVSGASHGSTHAPGETITLKASPAENFTFSKWQVEGVTLSDPTNATLTFTMPSNDIVVDAVFTRNPIKTIGVWDNINPQSVTKTNASFSPTFYYAPPLVNAALQYATGDYPSISFYLFADEDVEVVRGANPSISGSLLSGGGIAHSYEYTAKATPHAAEDLDYYYVPEKTLNLSSTGITPTPGKTYYYKFGALVKTNTAYVFYSSDVKSMKTTASTTTWSELSINKSGYGLFNGTVKWSKSLTLLEVGCFVSTDRSKVQAATRTNHSGVAFRQDVGQINTMASLSDSTTNGTVAFYKGPSFDTISSFLPGVTYYYKFYSYTSDKETVYSSIASYTPSGTSTQYTLNVKAGKGGSLYGDSSDYAQGSLKLTAGNVVNIAAIPEEGYTFDKWTTTAGSIAAPTQGITSFTMPASNATVTANFVPIKFSLTVSADNALCQVNTSVEGKYYAGDKITLKATAPDGMLFAFWTAEYGEFEDNTAAETTFTMPAMDTNIVAVFVGLTEMSISDPPETMIAGDRMQLLLYTTTSYVHNEDLGTTFTWYSSNPNCITVEDGGWITARYPGEAEISVVSNNGLKDSVTIRCETNVTEAALFVNGLPPTEITDVYYDVFEVGKAIPFSLEYQTSNGYDPGYKPSIYSLTSPYDDLDVVVDYGSHTLTFPTDGSFNVAADSREISSYFNNVIALGDHTLRLPQGLKEVEDEAFAGTNARIAIIPDSVTKIGSQAFPSVSIIMMNTSINRDIASDAFPNAYIIAETGSVFNSKYANEQYIYVVKRGTSVPESWSSWTEWSEFQVTPTNTLRVETAVQYRYRDKLTDLTYSDWGAWSAYDKVKKTITDPNLREERTATVWPYYYYVCTNCGLHMPVHGTNACYDCKGTVSSAWTEFWLPVNPSTLTGVYASWYTNTSKKWTADSKYGISFYNSDTKNYSSGTGYSYRSRTIKTEETWSDWSAWSNEAIEKSSSKQVETRTVYRYQYRVR
ncbi:MAG: leucine-rich repeat protein [Clostridia bacterium]|nr:leucine-rich repeat protein [Clostridia bacterium]MBR2287804.1 leucine-rich repeat protein [Clostridia bacterium]